MQQEWIVKRVEILELSMEGLSGLPAAVARLDERVSSLAQQFLQHRTEVRGEFSAARNEMRTLIAETNAQMRVLHEEVLDRIKTLNESDTPSPARRRRK